MKEYYVYILRCADKSYYTGVTNNYERRFQEHQSDMHPGSYTYKRRPLELVYVEIFHDVREAISREKQIKRWSKAKKEALIADNIENLHALSSCINGSYFSYYTIIHLYIQTNRIASIKTFSRTTMSGRA